MTANDVKRILGTVGVDSKQMFHGIYLASVVNTNDPLGQGRVTLKVPQVLGVATSNWADPLGFDPSVIPPPGTIVHAYFTGGDINMPVYAKIDLTAINSSIATLQSEITGLVGYPAAWSPVSLLEGWSNIGGFLPAQARVVSPGIVQVVGHIQGGIADNGTPVITVPSIATSAAQVIPVTVMSGGSSQADGFMSGDTDIAGLNDGTINGLSGTEGLDDGTINGTSASASGSGSHSHGSGSYAVSNGMHDHDSGSFAVADGTHQHGTSALVPVVNVNSIQPIIQIDSAGNGVLFNTSGAETQLSFSATLVAS